MQFDCIRVFIIVLFFLLLAIYFDFIVLNTFLGVEVDGACHRTLPASGSNPRPSVQLFCVLLASPCRMVNYLILYTSIPLKL